MPWEILSIAKPSPLTTLFAACTPRWLRGYRREFLAADLLAGGIVAIMLVPQSMAYALVAGLPAQYGMYASILPLLAYAWLGSSMKLAVGPVAVTSLMTAAALAPLAQAGSAPYIAGAALLALLSGVFLCLLGALRFGFVAKLLSNPVVSGFTSGSSLLIVLGQLEPLLGAPQSSGDTLTKTWALLRNIEHLHAPTAAIGIGALLLLATARRYLPELLRHGSCRANAADIIVKLVPMLVVAGAIALSALLRAAERHGVAVVGALPAGLPALGLPPLVLPQVEALLPSALAIGLINFVSSVSVAQALAVRRRQRIDANAELRALGAANIASALSGGFPVSGGFARSMVNDSAGARTPLSGVVSALVMAIVVGAAASLFAALPIAVLAATIVVAVAPVIDVGALRRAWHYDRADAIALAATALGVVVAGVEAGIAIGIGISLISLVWRSSHPHIAVIGRVPFTEHFRNVLRYQTEVLPHVLALRIDENLLFANAQAVEQRVRTELEGRPAVGHVLLVLSSVSQIDFTGLEMLRELNDALRARGIALHFSELKGPVLQRLRQSSLLQCLSGRVFLSTHQAFLHFSGDVEDYSI